MRNEADNIASIVQSLKSQNFPTRNLEIILIDDSSEDQTWDMAQKLITSFDYFHLIKLENGKRGKKEALKKAIEYAQGHLIVTSDADCILPPNWIKTIVCYYIRYSPRLISGPVFMLGRGWFSAFQTIEFMSLTASAAGAISIKKSTMSNAANMAFEKSLYLEFLSSNADQTTSGDDVFLLHFAKKKYDSKIHFLHSRDAIVQTYTQSSLSDFFRQRIRWTSKSHKYKDIDTILCAVIVLFSNFSLFACIILSVLQKFSLSWAAVLLLLKAVPDFILLFYASGFYRCRKLLIGFIPFSILYIFYIAFVGLLGSFLKFEWKGRKYSR